MSQAQTAGDEFSICRWWHDQGYPYTNFDFHGAMRAAAEDLAPVPNFYSHRPQVIDSEHLIGFLVEARWGLPFFEMRIPYFERQVKAHIWLLAPPENEEQAAMVVGISGIRSAEKAESIAVGLADSLVGRLSTELRVPLGSPSKRWVALPKGKVQITDTQELAVVAPPLTFEGFDRLQARLSEGIGQDDDVRFEIMRSALETEDTISGFLLLYSLLQAESGESQDDLDARIVAAMPEVQYETHTRNGRGRRETPYTRLRNDMMHPESAADIKGIRGRAHRLRRDLFSLCRLEIAGLPIKDAR